MTHRKPFVLTAIILSCSVLTLAGFHAAEAAGEPVTLDQLPREVRAALTDRLAGATIVEIERDREHGRDTFEIKAKNPDGRTVELVFAADGKFLRAENDDEGDHEDARGDDNNDNDDHEDADADDAQDEVITLDQAPAAVRGSLKGFTTPDRVLKVERLSGDDGDNDGEADDDAGEKGDADGIAYEIDYTDKDGGESSVRMTALGDILAIDHEIAPDALPAMILRELKEEHPGAIIGEVNTAQLFFYEIEITIDGTKHELLLDASGESVRGHGHDDDDDHGADDDGEEDDD